MRDNAETGINLASVPLRGGLLSLEGQMERKDSTLAEPWEANEASGKIAGDLANHLQNEVEVNTKANAS